MGRNKENDKKKEYARVLFLNNEPQNSIAEKVGVTAVTISKWVNQEGWKELRAAKAITRPELVNKLLLSVNNLLDTVNESDDPNALASIGDKLSKFAAVIEKLDKKSNVVDAMEVFMNFSQWLQNRISLDKELNTQNIKFITQYQDKYIQEQFVNKGV